jgi:FtsZ-binding cell division protein ZapB
MDMIADLEERIDRLVQGYAALRSRVAELEEENGKLRGDGGGVEALTQRISELENERNAVRERLEKLLQNVSSIEG